jgi:hypothetical protein
VTRSPPVGCLSVAAHPLRQIEGKHDESDESYAELAENFNKQQVRSPCPKPNHNVIAWFGLSARSLAHRRARSLQTACKKTSKHT